MRIVFSALAALFFLASNAWAQNNGVDLNPVIRDVVLPLMGVVLSAVATVAIGFISLWLNRKWGIDIEAKHRAALHSAIVTGINSAIAKAGPYTTVGPIPVSNPLTRMAMEYVLRSVPDAVTKFDLSEAKLVEMIQAKIMQVTQQTAPSVSPPVSP